MTSVILTTSPTFATIGGLSERIAADGYTLVRFPQVDAGYMEALASASFLVAGLPPVDAATIAAAPHLKGILKHGFGLDSIDIDAASRAGLAVTSTPGANAQAVAELALGAIFALSRNTVAGHESVAQGGWHRRRGREVAGCTLGILGFGQIGQRLARIARGVGMQVMAHDAYPVPDAAREIGVELVAFDTLLARADHLSLHISGGPSSTGLIGSQALARIKPGACLLNFARGSIVDLDALAHALGSGHLGGAALDAFVEEPPDISHAIFALPNTLFSPHSGADTAESIQRMGAMVYEDIQTLAHGHWPDRTVNTAAAGRSSGPAG
ncbi:hydroxypyruvate reductase [Antarctobacter heliothermus]|uniref:Hydroxypyruvate reductase n=1 Tax=Antarctobacter heliothermus TaxID=74033 RepID=A0A222EAN2_9RHOB|nr:phosphoglycerate dehydrogenase [Antarctobacter heliothermus]ASP23098.1 hydroxypyruvate reductase [Antarctobacter heliothermus]